MSERRIMRSDTASCPTCGCDTAVVRIRGNALAATCTSCRESTIVPLLFGDELDDVCGDRPTVRPVQLAYERMRRLGSRTAEQTVELAFAGDPDAQQECVAATRAAQQRRRASVVLRLPTP